MALGESAATPDTASHLATCAHCQSELAQLRAVVAAGRSTSPDEPVEAPPARVWDRIVDELQLTPAAARPAVTGRPYAVAGAAGVAGADGFGRGRRGPRWPAPGGGGGAGAPMGGARAGRGGGPTRVAGPRPGVGPG